MFVPGERHGWIVGVEFYAFAGDRYVIVGFDEDAAWRCFDLDFACAFDGCLANLTNRIAARAFVQATTDIDRGIARSANGERFARERNVLAGGKFEGNCGHRQHGTFVGEANGKYELPVGRPDVQEFVGAIFHDIELAAGGELQGVVWCGEFVDGGGERAVFRVVFHGRMITGF